jgi:glycerophosphoryl diester phosphodiesterase
MCVDGIMPAHPSRLEKVLDDRGIERPGQPGVDPCG